jgi:hypothetical protein
MSQKVAIQLIRPTQHRVPLLLLNEPDSLLVRVHAGRQPILCGLLGTSMRGPLEPASTSALDIGKMERTPSTILPRVSWRDETPHQEHSEVLSSSQERGGLRACRQALGDWRLGCQYLSDRQDRAESSVKIASYDRRKMKANVLYVQPCTMDFPSHMFSVSNQRAWNECGLVLLHIILVFLAVRALTRGSQWS